MDKTFTLTLLFGSMNLHQMNIVQFLLLFPAVISMFNHSTSSSIVRTHWTILRDVLTGIYCLHGQYLKPITPLCNLVLLKVSICYYDLIIIMFYGKVLLF